MRRGATKKGDLVRKIINRLLLAVAVIYVFTATASSQDAAGANTGESISISIETGRYDPAPGCKKDVDGCFPKVWTPTNTFTLGTRVWIRATLVNHSNLTAYADEYPELPSIPIDLVENRTGSSPRLTSEGCRLRQNACTPAPGSPTQGPLILSGLSDRWILPPGAPHVAIEEVTRQFVVAEAGEYSITADTGMFYWTTSDKIGPVGPVDKNFVRMSGTAESEPVHFIVTE